jgi:Pentapeptide repeats (8 copies)
LLAYNLPMPKQVRGFWGQWWSLVWRPLLIVVAAVLFVVVWWKVPPALYRNSVAGPDAHLKAITDTRTAMLAGLLGVGALLTFWLNSRVYRITARTFELTEQSHITERYTKAIEQLGDQELAVRLGGIYALEQLARHFPEREHPTVVEVLSAFVRDGSRRQSARPDEAAERTHSAAPEIDTEQPQPATDVQAALTVLGRLPQRSGVPRGDLSGAHLAGAQLDMANLSGARLARVDLSFASLAGANLSGAQLGSANLSRAWLEKTDLAGARLGGADLSGVLADGANLSDARLGGANLSSAWLGGAKLSGARLDIAQLAGADLRKAKGITQEQANAARGDGKTRLPAGLRRLDHWPAEEDAATASS